MTSLLAEILEGRELTDREQEILTLAAEGDTASDTAGRIFLSEETVKCYRKRVLAKLGARNMVNAVAIAFRKNLLG